MVTSLQKFNKEIRVSQEEVCQAKATSMSQQGAWMKWESAEARSLSWADIWSMEPLMLKFLLRSTYNVLPSPANLKIWKLIQDDKCQKCPGRATAEHILNGCPASLSSGMYKWRHDQVLKEIDIAVRAVVNQVNEILVPSKSVKHIDFVKEGGEVFIPQVDYQTGCYIQLMIGPFSLILMNNYPFHQKLSSLTSDQI